MTATTRTPDLPHEKLLSRENSRKDGPFGVSGPSSINRRLEPTISELGNRRNEEQAPALAALALSVRSWLVPGEGLQKFHPGACRCIPFSAIRSKYTLDWHRSGAICYP
jgi:hypothetical protein